MLPEEFQTLLGDWQRINNETRPTADLFSTPSGDASVIKDICFVSSRKEFWEPMVYLLAYDKDPDVEATADEAIDAIGRDLGKATYSTETNEFLDYCKVNSSDVDGEAIVMAIDVVLNVASPDKIKDLLVSTSRIITCKDLYPDDPEKFRECLAAKSPE